MRGLSRDPRTSVSRCSENRPPGVFWPHDDDRRDYIRAGNEPECVEQAENCAEGKYESNQSSGNCSRRNLFTGLGRVWWRLIAAHKKAFTRVVGLCAVDADAELTSYAYGPSITLKNGVYHVFFCSAGASPAWDFVRYVHSTDGRTWSTSCCARDRRRKRVRAVSFLYFPKSCTEASHYRC
jgi:hypothetical protein